MPLGPRGHQRRRALWRLTKREPSRRAAHERSGRRRTSRGSRPAADRARSGRFAEHASCLPRLVLSVVLWFTDSPTPFAVTALLLIAGVIIFAMVVAGVWLTQYAVAEPAARAVGRAPDPAEEEEARQTRSTSRPSFLRDREPV